MCGRAGDNVNAPYRKEHFFATNLERLFASELGVDWFEYDRYVDALGIEEIAQLRSPLGPQTASLE